MLLLVFTQATVKISKWARGGLIFLRSVLAGRSPSPRLEEILVQDFTWIWEQGSGWDLLCSLQIWTLFIFHSRDDFQFFHEPVCLWYLPETLVELVLVVAVTPVIMDLLLLLILIFIYLCFPGRRLGWLWNFLSGHIQTNFVPWGISILKIPRRKKSQMLHFTQSKMQSTCLLWVSSKKHCEYL